MYEYGAASRRRCERRGTRFVCVQCRIGSLRKALPYQCCRKPALRASCCKVRIEGPHIGYERAASCRSRATDTTFHASSFSSLKRKWVCWMVNNTERGHEMQCRADNTEITETSEVNSKVNSEVNSRRNAERNARGRMHDRCTDVRGHGVVLRHATGGNLVGASEIFSRWLLRRRCS
jgi:hypothetical protein